MSEERHLDLMMRSKLFEGFTREECRDLHLRLAPTTKNYVKGQMICSAGDPINAIGIIDTGRILQTKFYYAGHSHILQVLGPMDLIGVEIVATPSRVSPVTMTAQAVTAVLSFSYSSLIRNPNLSSREQITLMENFIHLLANEGIRQMYKIEVLSRRSLRGRIMTYLSLMRQKLGRDYFSIRMTQEQFSQYLCVNRSALSAELNDMQREGLIRFRRNQFTINTEHEIWNNYE